MTAGDRVTRWYYRSDRLVDAALRMLRGAFDGLWLGLLSRDGLARIDQAYYDGERMYLTDGYNHRGLWDWERAAVDRHFRGARRVVVTSAGGGREVLALSRAGFEVVGFEPHPGFAEFGNALLCDAGVDARIEPSARDVWPGQGTGFDAAIVGWGGYMLIPGRARRVAFLRNAAACLPPGAPILLSFFTRGGRNARFRVATRVGNLLRRVRRRVDPVELGDALVPNLAHFFSRDEITAELADAGISVIDYGTEEYGWAVGRVDGPENRSNDARSDFVEAARGRGRMAGG